MHFPALELIWSPWSAGAVVHGHTLRVGGVEPVPQTGLSFGFEGNVRLKFPPSHEAPVICRIENRHGVLKLTHYYRTRHHCGINGRRVEDLELQLRHGDVVSFVKGPVFRVLHRERPVVRSASLEAAVAAAPDDLAALHVYRDFLLDGGDPLGERLAHPRSVSPGDDGRLLDALAVHYEAGLLDVAWEYGLAATAVLRRSLAVFATQAQALAHLAALPVMRFLRELTFDVSSDDRSVADGLEALAAVSLPATVRRISLGDVPVSQREQVEPLLVRSAGRVHVGYYRDAVLEQLPLEGEAPFESRASLPVGNRIELGRGEATSHLYNVVLGGSHLVVREGPRFMLSRIDRSADCAKVNGRRVDRFPLRDGDVIELGDALKARFTLVR